MLSRAEISAALRRDLLIAVVRTDDPEQIPFICEALLSGGVKSIEITLTVPNALRAVKSASTNFGSLGLIGVGSVLDAQSCDAAIEAGAQFVVSPILRPELVGIAHSAGKPVMLGACTPTEAQVVHESGADFVKLFPAEKLGPAFVKAILAPLPHLRIVPTGGVDTATAVEFLRAGCVALGLGGSLLTREILRAGRWPELASSARAFVKLVSGYRCE
jgi:2-dehydro-3-deoxyphosphogluconate aldolase/(4S)-4-hydroxy-2-oxoglutarate aldolase